MRLVRPVDFKVEHRMSCGILLKAESCSCWSAPVLYDIGGHAWLRMSHVSSSCALDTLTTRLWLDERDAGRRWSRLEGCMRQVHVCSLGLTELEACMYLL